MMDDLISRKAAIDQTMGKLDYVDTIFDKPTESEIVYMLRSLPSVPAVPLEQLCKRLCDIDEVPACLTCCNLKIYDYCNDCGSAEHWHAVITKLMENQNE